MHMDPGKTERLNLLSEMRILVEMNLEIFCAEFL